MRSQLSWLSLESAGDSWHDVLFLKIAALGSIMRESVNTDRSLLIFDAYAKSELSDFSVSDFSKLIFAVVIRSFNEFTTCSFGPKMPPSCTVATGCYEAVRRYV